MSKFEVVAAAEGSSAAITVPGNGPIADLRNAKWVRITTKDSKRSGVFEVDPRPREGAEDNSVFVLPGSLGLKYGETASAVAVSMSRWAYRRSQLKSPTGLLLLLTLFAALVPATIDLSLAVGKSWFVWIWLDAGAIGALGVASFTCKMCTPIFAFLLALWFKKPG
jgi:hypothetical protein